MSTQRKLNDLVITTLDALGPTPVKDVTKMSNDEGLDWVLINKELSGTKDLWVGLFVMNPNEEHPRHFHRDVGEFYFVVHGSCTLLGKSQQEVIIRAGTAVYIPPTGVHGLRTSNNELCSIVYGFPHGDFHQIETIWV